MREMIGRKDENHYEWLDVRLGHQRWTPLRTACRILLTVDRNGINESDMVLPVGKDAFDFSSS